METKDLGGVVRLDQVLPAPHSYAVGEIKNAEGEITAYNGKVLLNYGQDGINKSTGEVPRGEEAMQLISAQVEKWMEIVIPRNMADSELNRFILEQAERAGVNTKTPFPFLLEGVVNELVWHVRSGADVGLAGQEKRMFLTKLVEYREESSVILVGFCSEINSGYAHPGEPWHMHVILDNEKVTGHVDAFSVLKGARLLLPAS